MVSNAARADQHAAATCMFALGFIFMVNESRELSVIFVPLVLPEQTLMVEVVVVFGSGPVRVRLLTFSPLPGGAG